MPSRTAYAGAAVAGEVLTAANVNKGPGGWIGYEQVTANQGSITTVVDVTGLSAAVTVGTSRRIRVSYVGALAGSVANDLAVCQIQEGATILQTTNAVFLPTGLAFPARCSVVLTPPAGAHTYKITCVRGGGSGVIQHTATSTAPAFILVEDIGPAT